MPIALLPSGIKIAYELNGNPANAPIILLHGHGSRGSTFKEFISCIETDFFILTLDLRGHGASGKPLGTDYETSLPFYSISQFADDLFDLVEDILFPWPFVLVGHNLGGMIAQIFTLVHPQTVSHLVLCGTVATWYTDGRADILTQMKEGSLPLNEAFFQVSVTTGMTRAYRKAHPEVFISSVQSRMLVPPTIYMAIVEQILFSFDTREHLPDLSMPTLILVGDKDALVESTKSEELHELLPNSQIIIIAGQNHGIFHEVPDRVSWGNSGVPPQ